MRFFEYRHHVGFAETNLVGNVYYVHYLSWQGRCREMFLKQYWPQFLEELAQGLAMVTTRCNCEYYAELQALDEVSLRMHLEGLEQNRITMSFEYWRLNGGEELVARGGQQVALMKRRGDGLVAVPVPSALRRALAPYQQRMGAGTG